jgi:hypothetical protein
MKYGNIFCGNEKADGDVPADQWAVAVIKVSCILIVGVIILSGVVTAANVTCGPFAGLMVTIRGNITSGYQLVALMIIVISAGAILHFLGFM